MQNYNSISPIERIIASATYVTVGGVGFIWLIIATLLKRRVTTFLMYHIFQSIFISIGYFLLVKICALIYVILYKIPIINAIPFYLNMPLPLLFNFSLLQTIEVGTIIYLTITSFCGLYSYLPYVSNIININIGRR